jgi:hypothetical protein
MRFQTSYLFSDIGNMIFRSWLIEACMHDAKSKFAVFSSPLWRGVWCPYVRTGGDQQVYAAGARETFMQSRPTATGSTLR